MKAIFHIVLATVLLQTIFADVKPQGNCRLASIIPKGGILVPELDFNEDDGLPLPQDPLPVENITVHLKEDIISGNYSFWNGLVIGLSSLQYSVCINPIFQRLNLNITLLHARLTGDYEIKDGKIDLPGVGVHTVGGNGPLNVSAAGVEAYVGVTLKFNLTDHHVSIDRLKLNLTFTSAHVFADKLTMDGKPIDWELINKLLKPMFDLFWPEHQDAVASQIQEKVNGLLEGCTLEELLSLVSPLQKPGPVQIHFKDRS